MDKILAVMALCPQHYFMPLSKQPDAIVEYLTMPTEVRTRVAKWLVDSCIFTSKTIAEGILHGWRPLVSEKTSFGCSVMNQPEADKYRPPMAALAAMGIRTHVWYEPATGPIDWKGWEFLTFIISGGESGSQARPSHPQWHRNTRDFCIAHGIEYNLKQWGSWAPYYAAGLAKGWESAGPGTGRGRLLAQGELFAADRAKPALESRFIEPGMVGVVRIDKHVAGRTLDGRTWDGVPFPKESA
jgi:protein gp37